MRLLTPFIAIASLSLFAQPIHAWSPSVVNVQGGEQAAQSTQPSNFPTPSVTDLNRMIWSTISAIDHANRVGNYSVLRDISARTFQDNYTPVQLADIFASLRQSDLDLTTVFLVTPTYVAPPQVIRPDMFRTRGVFQLNPTSLQFDMVFIWEQRRWKLAAIDVQTVEIASNGQAGQ